MLAEIEAEFFRSDETRSGMIKSVSLQSTHEPPNENAATNRSAPQCTKNVCVTGRQADILGEQTGHQHADHAADHGGNTSSVSSSVDALFFQCTQRFEITLATVPMNMLSPMLT